MGKSLITLILITLISFNLHSQDKEYAYEILDSLGSQRMAGRGYVNHGALKAARYIHSELEKHGVQALKHTYFQYFNVDVNTFPSVPYIQIDSTVMVAGYDYIPIATSGSVNDTFDLMWLSPEILSDSLAIEELAKQDLSETVLIVEDTGFAHPAFCYRISKAIVYRDYLEAAGVILLEKKLVMIRYNDEGEVPTIKMQIDSIPKNPKKVIMRIEAELLKDYKTQNVFGYIPGKKKNKYIMFTAHYDHMGMLGDSVWFAGANDNASGTAMLLDLARYYNSLSEPPDYNIVFMFCGAEENGIMGSEYYVKHPLFDLNDIEVVINLDMVGSGEDGINVSGGHIHKKFFKKMVKINDKKQYVKKVSASRYCSCSDHSPFHEAGIPALFVHTTGKYPWYHDVYDVPERVPFSDYDDFFKLLIDFVESL